MKGKKVIISFMFLFQIFFISCQSKNPFYGIDKEDKDGPDIYIDYPIPGSIITSTFTLIGRAKDKGGDNTVLKIEISLDNGNTWYLAGGTTNWSYTIDPFSSWGVVSNETRSIKIRATDTDYKRNISIIQVSYIINNTNPDLLGSIKDSNDTVTYNGTPGYDGYHNNTEGNIIRYEWDNISGAVGYEMTLYNTTDSTSSIGSFDTPSAGNPIDCSSTYSTTGVSNVSFGFTGTKVYLRFQGVDGKKYYLAVKPYDSSAQRGPVQISVAETIDTLPPTTVSSLRVNGKLDTDPDKYFSTRNITLSWGHATDIHTSIRYYKIDIDNNGSFDLTVDGSINNYTYTYSADGTYTARIVAVDMAGNNSAPVTITFTIDTVTPGTIVVINDNGTTYNGRKVIRNNHKPDGLRVVKYTFSDVADARYYTIRVNEVTSGVYDEYTIDKTSVPGTLPDGVNTGITSVNWLLGGGIFTFRFTGQDGKKYYISVRPIDNAGNIGAASNSQVVWVDDTVPTAGTVTDPGNYINSTTVSFNWTGFSDVGSGIETYMAASSDDGSNWSADQNLGLVTFISTTGWAPETFDNGENVRLRVKAVDYVGNESNWAISNGIIIDTLSPTFTLISTPSTDSYTNTSPINFTGFNGTDTNFRYYEYMIVDNGIPGTIQTTTVGTTNPVITITPVNGHTYKIIARAVDWAGNTSGWISSNLIGYDISNPAAPTTVLVDGSSSTLYYNTTKNVNIIWSAVTDFSGVQYYQIDINNDSIPDGPNEGGTFATRNLGSEGIYNIRVRAVDNANNIGNWSGAISVYIDLTSPTDVSSLNGTYNAPDINFSWNAATDSLSGIKQYKVQYNVYDGTNWFGWSPSLETTLTTYTYDASNIPNGYTIKIRVQAEDKAGNLSNWVESNEVTKP